MNRRWFLGGLIAGVVATPVAAQYIIEQFENFEEAWNRRVALAILPAAEKFDEDQFNDEIRKRMLTPPPKEHKRRPLRRRVRVAHRHYRYRRRRYV